MQSTYRLRHILLPVKPRFIFITFALALVANVLPVSRFYLMPDFVALVLTLWAVREPTRVGIGIAFLLGIFVDIGQDSLMGQHALVYVLMAYVCNLTASRLSWFSPVVQALQVGPLFLGAQIIMLVVRLISDGYFPGWSYFLSSVTTTLLWVPFYYLFLLPQMRPVSRDENRTL